MTSIRTQKITGAEISAVLAKNLSNSDLFVDVATHGKTTLVSPLDLYYSKV